MIKKAYYIALIFTLIFSSSSYALRAPLKFSENLSLNVAIADINTYLEMLGPRISEDRLAGRLRYEDAKKIAALGVVDKLLSDRLKKILSRKFYNDNIAEDDILTIALLYYNYKFSEYFNHRQELTKNLRGGVGLSRDTLTRIIRELFDPTYERHGFIVIDFFAGREKEPTILDKDVLAEAGYNGENEVFVYGVDNAIPWNIVSAEGKTGVIRGDVFDLAIPRRSADLVTMFNPQPYEADFMVKAAKKILRDGGWVYIAPHKQTVKGTRGVFVSDFKYSLEDCGFKNIKAVKPYPTNFTMPENSKPYCLIKAQMNVISEEKTIRNKLSLFWRKTFSTAN